MTRPLTIGLMTPGWPGTNTPNGIATAVYELARGLQKIGHRPVILTGKIDGTGPEGIPVFPISRDPLRVFEKLQLRLGSNAGVYNSLTRGIAHSVLAAHRAQGLDAVILEETHGWAGGVQSLVDIPVITTLHGPWKILAQGMRGKLTREDRRRQTREAVAFQKVRGLIAPSATTLAVVADMPECAAIPQIVIPNAFDPGPTPVNRPPEAAHNILFVGRFDRLKGADTVLAAFQLLSKQNPKARLTFVGPDPGIAQSDGSLLKIDEALANMPPDIREKITYLGRRRREEIGDLRKTHGIALIASRYEVFGYTVLEAMAAGQAIACTDVGGPSEILKDGETALLVPPSAPNEMAAALARLMADPDLAQTLTRAAYDQVVAEYAPSVIATKTADFIEKALG